jgi:hypothetical protein
MSDVSSSSHRLYTLCPPRAVSETRTASSSRLLRRSLNQRLAAVRMIDTRDPSELFLPALVPPPFSTPGHPAFRPSHAAQKSPLGRCPVCSSSPSAAYSFSHLADTSRRRLSDKQCAVRSRGRTVPFQCSPSQRTPEITVPNVR